MKLLRLWLLVLLAAMLPLQGALAAAMLCAGGHGHGHARHAEVHAQHRHADGTQHDHGTADQDKCSFCTAFCSLTPLVSDIAGVAEPSGLVDAPLPSLSALAPSFLSDGPERPPRSI
ncbi:hypothetical protein [Piscinibacter sp.]|uniref:hypothetical protein n=1 Tax=Piscinibacter sp. TaxID=1903157 RepID=UPI0039E2874D